MPDDSPSNSQTIVQLEPVGLAANPRYREGGTAAFVDRVFEELPLPLNDVDVLVSGTEKTFTDELVDRAEQGQLDVSVTRRFHRWKRFLNDPRVRAKAAERADRDGADLKPKLPDPTSADLGSIDEAWKQAAKQKAVATLDHYLGDEWYDQYLDVDYRVLVHDGSRSGLDRVAHGRGVNEWVDNGDGSIKATVDLNLSEHILWGRFFVDVGRIECADDLEEGQAAELTSAQRQALDLPVEDDEPGPLEASSTPAD